MGVTSLADIEPVRLRRGEQVAVPGSDLAVVLHRHRYVRGRSSDGTSRVVKWAELTISTAGGDTRTERFPLDAVHEVFGHRLFLTGARTALSLYLLPPVEEEAT